MNAKATSAALWVAVALTVGPPSASAQPADSVKPGRQANPPGPAAPEPKPQATDDGQRRAIRGCPVDQDCHEDQLRGLHEFEREAFPRRADHSPWIDSDDRDGHNAVRFRYIRRADGPPGEVLRPVPKKRKKRSTKATDVRPDLEWLADLEMPDLPVTWDDRVIAYLEFYKNDPRGRSLMESWIAAQGKYKNLILRELREAELPDDLLYISMIESSYAPEQVSYAGAAGLWQFMSGSGRVYGLRVDRWVDDRLDPVLATKAVTKFWADLYHRFGDWDLAMAAYNAGYGAVLKAMAKYNTNDFWQLLDYENALPWASANYVPKALATAIVGHNLKAFGFDSVARDPALDWDAVTVPKSVSINVIARAAGVKTDAIEALNPQLRRKRTPPGEVDYIVRVPKGTGKLFAERFPQLRGDWDKHDAYLVRHGERFEDIATMHGISYRDLRELNGIDSEAEVRGGTYLVVPKVSDADKKANLEKANANLYSSGEPGGEDGEPLLVAVPDKDLVVRGRKRVFYRVVSGDTQYDIATTFGVSREDLAKWNGLDIEAHLAPRMVMQLWVSRSFNAGRAKVKLLDPKRIRVVEAGSKEHLDEVERRVGRKRVNYKASKRESYETIGKRFGLSARDLARINSKPPNTVLEPGEACVVYDVADRSESERAAEQARAKARSNPKPRNRSRKKKVAPPVKAKPAAKKAKPAPAKKEAAKPAPEPAKKAAEDKAPEPAAKKQDKAPEPAAKKQDEPAASKQDEAPAEKQDKAPESAPADDKSE